MGGKAPGRGGRLFRSRAGMCLVELRLSESCVPRVKSGPVGQGSYGPDPSAFRGRLFQGVKANLQGEKELQDGMEGQKGYPVQKCCKFTCDPGQ